MGESTFIADTSVDVVRPRRRFRMALDLPLVLAVTTLASFGLLMVYSASWQFSMQLNQPSSYMLTRQMIWLAIGGVVAFILSRVNYHRYQKLVIPMVSLTLLMLMFVLAIRDTRLGADRTLLWGSVQPSELSKVVVIIYLSFWLYSKKDVINDKALGLIPMMVILGTFAGLVLAQPDLSAAATIIFLGVMLFFLVGGEFRHIVLVAVIALFVGLIVLTISHTGKTRVVDYLAGLQNPIQASYHVQRSMEAVVKGGLFGVGIGRATTKFTGLPVAPTDSIFAVVTEETGLLGAGLMVFLYGVILWRGLMIAQRAPDLLGKLLASGLSIWIFMEAVINMGVMVNLFPFAGNALPLVSAGGSSLTMTLASIGIILNIARSSAKTSTPERRFLGALVNFGRRDRRGRLSRSGRASRVGRQG